MSEHIALVVGNTDQGGARTVNPTKCSANDYLQFLIAAQSRFTCTEAARCQPDAPDRPAHDAFNRLLLRLPAKTRALWRDARRLIDRTDGLLVMDDSALDKPYAPHMELVGWHWSGKHRRVVEGIDLMTLLWSNGHALAPCDFRVYHFATDARTKNHHFADLLHVAHQRGLQPRYVAFDSWFSGWENLKTVRDYGWHWLTRFKSNRLVNPDDTRNVPIREVVIGAAGLVVHLKGYGMVKVFRTVSSDGDADYWATDDLTMSESQRQTLADQSWGIEAYHRGLKQCCGVERVQARRAVAIRNHVGLALRAFVRLEAHRLRTAVSVGMKPNCELCAPQLPITCCIPVITASQLRNS